MCIKWTLIPKVFFVINSLIYFFGIMQTFFIISFCTLQFSRIFIDIYSTTFLGIGLSGGDNGQNFCFIHVKSDEMQHLIIAACNHRTFIAENGEQSFLYFDLNLPF